MSERHEASGVLVEERPDGRELHGVAQQKPTIGSPLKVRNFQLLLGGQTISALGDVFYVVALPWLAFTMGGGAQEPGSVLAADGIPRATAGLPVSPRHAMRSSETFVA